MLRDVREGLAQNPKRLSPKYFYDERGSELFEQITDLPEYYLTRAERGLLGGTIPGIIEKIAPKSLVELGAGSASKTRIILDAMIARGSATAYVPIDVSRDFLETTAASLREDYPKSSSLLSSLTSRSRSFFPGSQLLFSSPFSEAQSETSRATAR